MSQVSIQKSRQPRRPKRPALTPAQAKKRRLRTLVWLIPSMLVAAVLVVLAARGLRELPGVQSFLASYPGHSELPDGAPVGIPVWLSWQHGLNAFFLIMIARTGWLVRTTQRPAAHWTRNNAGPLRTKNPPRTVSLDLWLHLSLDVLWVLNGVIFIVLLFVTGQWMRIVPTNWDIFPNALSAALQYASFNWPIEMGWVNYNGLQVLAYFVTVFIAAPLAIITGLRMSGAWPRNATRLNKAYPLELARAVHFPVMIYFVAFIVMHVTLVFTTGILFNLNYMFAANNGESWVGFGIFAGFVLLVVAAWMLARPIFLRPIAALTGRVSK